MSPGDAQYRAVYPEIVRVALDGYVDELLAAGWDKRSIADVIQAMDNRLTYDPHEFGEPLYTLRTIRAKVFVGFVRPFSVQFSVHEESRSVFVRKLVLMTADKPS